MAIPEQVKRQTDAANKLMEDLGKDLLAVDDQTTQPAPPPAPVPAPDIAAQLDVAEQRYRTLQGMHRSDLERLNGVIKDQQALIATMSAAPPAPAPAPVVTTKLVTDADEAEYGESIGVMRRAAREEAAAIYEPIIKDLKARIDSLADLAPKVTSLQHKQTVDADQKFWTDLTSMVPDWRDTNADLQFQAWLLERDPFSGLVRQTLLEDAHRNLDATRVARFFTIWKGEKSPPVTTIPPKTASELELQAAPGRSRSAPPSSSTNTTTYTRADIAKFYQDVSAGKYKGREDEKARMERDIFAAQREDRIAS